VLAARPEVIDRARRPFAAPAGVRAIRRAAICIALGVSVVAGLGGCGQYGAAFRQRELVVKFSSSATQAQHLAARRACAGATPAATPEPLPSGKHPRPSQLAGNVRFRIDNAGDRQLKVLTECLRRQPGVLGITIPETM
jgi:hypothetical protein